MYKRIFEDFFNDIDINDEDINKSHDLVTNDEKSHQKYILKTEIEYEYYEHPEQKNENVFYIYKYLLEVFNTLITVDSVSLETKLILNINADDNNITIDNFIPQKDKTNAFDYFPEYKDNFSWSTTIIYEINIYFNIIVNSTFNQFCTDIDKIDNMLDKIEIGSYILSKTSDEIKNGEYIQSKKYKSNDELVKIYAKLYDKNDDEILSTENSDMYFYRKYKIKDKILDYLKSSKLDIVNYDIEIRDFPKSLEIIDIGVPEKKVVLVTVILKTPEKDSVYQLYQNSCLIDLKD